MQQMRTRHVVVSTKLRDSKELASIVVTEMTVESVRLLIMCT